MTEKGCVGELVAQWRMGDEAAAAELYRRYAARLCVLAAGLLGERLSRRVAADDIVQSVFRSFFRRAGEDRLMIRDSGSLWHLLKKITENKVRRQGERHRAAKRDVGAEVALEPDGAWQLLENTAGEEPDPGDAAALAEEIAFLLSNLKAPEPRIFELALAGYTAPEITLQVGCSRWTVRRTLNRLGKRLAQRLGYAEEDEVG